MTKTIVTRTEMCGEKSVDGVVCGRPAGHGGPHLSADHAVRWGDGSSGSAIARGFPATVAAIFDALPPPEGPCQARHLSGRACALALGHAGSHRTGDHLLHWVS